MSSRILTVSSCPSKQPMRAASAHLYQLLVKTFYYFQCRCPRPMAGYAPLRTDRGIRPRLVSSALFVIPYFVFVLKEYFCYRNSEECFLFTKPTTRRNAGSWAISTAILVLVVHFPIFLRCQESSIKAGENLMNRTLASFYHEDSGGPANPEREPASKKGLIRKLFRLFCGLRRILAWMIYAVGKVVQWLYHRELSFPVGTWIYFLWNTIDVGHLKQTNTDLLAGGGEEEQNFGAFGQIVLWLRVLVRSMNCWQEPRLKTSKQRFAFA